MGGGDSQYYFFGKITKLLSVINHFIYPVLFCKNHKDLCLIADNILWWRHATGLLLLDFKILEILIVQIGSSPINTGYQHCIVHWVKKIKKFLLSILSHDSYIIPFLNIFVRYNLNLRRNPFTESIIMKILL